MAINYDRLGPRDWQKLEEVKMVRDILPIAAELRVRFLRDCCGVYEDDAIREVAELIENLRQAPRKELVNFLMDQEALLRDFSEEANPGTQEWDFAKAIRKLHLIKTLFNDVEAEVPGSLVVASVDAFLAQSSLNLHNLSILE